LKFTSHTILLVEDDPDDVLLVKDALRDKTHLKLLHEKNGLEALNYLKELRAKSLSLPCLIIMDINMPVLNGKELLSIIKHEEYFHSIPLIVFTTSASEKDKEFCNRFRVPMITKPYDMQTFNQTVNDFIEHCQN
jgi:CheY-like chemotaxis protein